MIENNIKIIYHIDLEVYKKVKIKNYYYFSKSEIIEQMLWGEVLILNTDGSFFSFEADLFKFFIVFTDNLKKISLKEEHKNQIFSVYDDYLFFL